MLIVNAPESAPFYAPGGWRHWPDNEDYSHRFMQILGTAQEGGSTLSECLLAASRITPGDDESWHREWRKLADASKNTGDLALRRGNTCTAQSNWLRASNYYRAAELFLNIGDGRRQFVLEQMQMCSHLYLDNLNPKGEIVHIPGAAGDLMPAYFLRASGSALQTPVVICIGGPDHLKEEHLYKMPRQAHARGLSLLVVDLPGQGTTPRENAKLGPNSIEESIGYCVDYLIGRGDVDVQRIALFGESLGASYASQAAASDHRFSAVVCDGGLWDLHERAFVLEKICSGKKQKSIKDQISRLWPHTLATRIECPILVTLGEYDWLEMSCAAEFYRYLQGAGLNVSLKIFLAAETAASHAQIDNPTIGNEFIFDWIAERIGRRGRIKRAVGNGILEFGRKSE